MSLSVANILTAQLTCSGSSPTNQSLPGAEVGDVVLNIYQTSATNQYSSTFVGLFESVISTADEIHQSGGGNLSGDSPLTVILMRPISC